MRAGLERPSMTIKKQADQVDAQRQRFVETARELGCGEDEAAFDEVLGKVASAPPPKSVEKRKTQKPAK